MTPTYQAKERKRSILIGLSRLGWLDFLINRVTINPLYLIHLAAKGTSYVFFNLRHNFGESPKSLALIATVVEQVFHQYSHIFRRLFAAILGDRSLLTNQADALSPLAATATSLRETRFNFFYCFQNLPQVCCILRTRWLRLSVKCLNHISEQLAHWHLATFCFALQPLILGIVQAHSEHFLSSSSHNCQWVLPWYYTPSIIQTFTQKAKHLFAAGVSISIYSLHSPRMRVVSL